jgi:hypothetical protein
VPKKTAAEYLRDYFDIPNPPPGWTSIMEEYALYCAAEALKGCAKHPDTPLVCLPCQGTRALAKRTIWPTQAERSKWGSLGGRAKGNGKGWPKGKRRPKKPALPPPQDEGAPTIP